MARMQTHTIAETPQTGIGPIRALVIDDNDLDICRLRRLCQKAGLQMLFDEASYISEMQCLLDSNVYDVVFIDYHLGMETGMEALAVLKAHPDQAGALPIMVTSVTGHETAIQAMREGCADYLVKEELSVSAIRKSLASALERQILLSAVSEARLFQLTTQRMIERYAASFGPELRSVLSKLRASMGTLTKNPALDPRLRSEITTAEVAARDVLVLLDDLATLAHDIETGSFRNLAASQ